MADRLVIDADNPDPALMARAGTIIRSGGVVGFPTDTLYGLAANPFDEEAVQRVFAVKGRQPDQPVALVAASGRQVMECIGALSGPARTLADRLWPGPLTLLLPAPRTLASGIASASGTVGVRVPDHAVARALCDVSGCPLTATSANRSGNPPSDDPDAVWQALGDRLDLLLDAGRTPGGAPSTIVDVSGPTPRLIREGAIRWETIASWWIDA